MSRERKSKIPTKKTTTLQFMPKHIEVVRDWFWEHVWDEVFQVIGYKAGTLVQPETICQELARGILQTDIGPKAKLVENVKLL